MGGKGGKQDQRQPAAIEPEPGAPALNSVPRLRVIRTGPTTLSQGREKVKHNDDDQSDHEYDEMVVLQMIINQSSRPWRAKIRSTRSAPSRCARRGHPDMERRRSHG